jgi:2-iminobutanoate/2-iminopropanoate deaminase
MSTIRTVSAAPAVPAEIGPWSHAVVAGDLVFVSGCPPWDPHTNALNLGPFDAQARQCMANLRTIVEHAGSALERIVKVTVRAVRAEGI